MKTIIAFSALLFIALTCSASPTATHAHDVDLVVDTTVAGTTLSAGHYQVVVDGAFATFSLNGKEVAVAAVQREDAAARFNDNLVVIAADGHTLVEIDLEGAAIRYLVIGAGRAPSASAR